MNTIKLVVAVSIVLVSLSLFSHLVINTYGQIGPLQIEHEQRNRDYIQKLAGVPYPDPDSSKSLFHLNVIFKTRDKYSDEMLPLANTIIDSFKFIEIKK